VSGRLEVHCKPSVRAVDDRVMLLCVMQTDMSDATVLPAWCQYGLFADAHHLTGLVVSKRAVRGEEVIWVVAHADGLQPNVKLDFRDW